MVRLGETLSEFRYNKLKREWVLFSPKRAKRPNNYKSSVVIDEIKSCPFEVGYEGLTTKEIDRVGDEKSWSCRVIPNLYNALSIEDSLESKRDTYFEKRGGFGAHEVIIETPKHHLKMYHFEKEQFFDYLTILKRRFDSLKKDLRIEYISLFKNCGENAGASLEHSHSQLIAMAFTPPKIQEDIKEFKDFYNEHKRNFFDDLIYEERSYEEGVLFENSSFIALCPYASKFAFEVLIVAKKELCSFSDFEKEDLEELSKMLTYVFKKLHSALDDFAYNLLIKNAPINEEDKSSYRFHIEIIPRLYKIAGYELSSDIHINTILPEEALKILKHEKKG